MNEQPKFQFSNVVVVEGNLIGVILKTWHNIAGYTYEVYVRSYNAIKEIPEGGIRHFVYDKELTDEDLIYQNR